MSKAISPQSEFPELAPPAVYQAVAAVAGLQKGRTAAHETEPGPPVRRSASASKLKRGPGTRCETG